MVSICSFVLFLLCIIVPTVAITAPTSSHKLFFKCVEPAEPGAQPSKDFCNFPPTVPVDLNVYKGTWFNIYNSGFATRFVQGNCVTANYQVARNGTITVLNCSQVRRRKQVVCVRGAARRRPGTVAPGKLEVFFPGTRPGLGNPGPYNIVALLGNRKIGYLAAAVYFCATAPGGVRLQGLFILSRTTIFRRTVLFLLKRQLRCKGFDVSGPFVKIVHTKRCDYFFEDGGFTVQGDVSG